MIIQTIVDPNSPYRGSARGPDDDEQDTRVCPYLASEQ